MAPETTGKVMQAGLEAKALVEEVQQIIKQKAQKVGTYRCRAVCLEYQLQVGCPSSVLAADGRSV